MSENEPAKGIAGQFRRRILFGSLLIAMITLIYVALHRTGTLSLFMDSENLHAVIEGAGALGPLVIIGFFMVIKECTIMPVLQDIICSCKPCRPCTENRGLFTCF